MKLKRIFENKRRTTNQQFSTKGGRPRVEVVNEGPAAKVPRNADSHSMFNLSFLVFKE